MILGKARKRVATTEEQEAEEEKEEEEEEATGGRTKRCERKRGERGNAAPRRCLERETI